MAAACLSCCCCPFAPVRNHTTHRRAASQRKKRKIVRRSRLNRPTCSTPQRIQFCKVAACPISGPSAAGRRGGLQVDTCLRESKLLGMKLVGRSDGSISCHGIAMAWHHGRARGALNYCRSNTRGSTVVYTGRITFRGGVGRKKKAQRSTRTAVPS